MLNYNRGFEQLPNSMLNDSEADLEPSNDFCFDNHDHDGEDDEQSNVLI